MLDQNNVPGKSPEQSTPGEINREGCLHEIPTNKSANLLELLRPGSFVKLENQPNDLPPFKLIACRGGRCLVRQQTWGKYIHWEVEHHRLKSA